LRFLSADKGRKLAVTEDVYSSPVFEYMDVHIPTIASASEDAYTHNLRIDKIRRNRTLNIQQNTLKSKKNGLSL
jgi:hypothetical protein